MVAGIGRCTGGVKGGAQACSSRSTSKLWRCAMRPGWVTESIMCHSRTRCTVVRNRVGCHRG